MRSSSTSSPCPVQRCVETRRVFELGRLRNQERGIMTSTSAFVEDGVPPRKATRRTHDHRSGQHLAAAPPSNRLLFVGLSLRASLAPLPWSVSGRRTPGGEHP